MSAAAAAAAGHPLALLGLIEGDFVLIRYRVAGARIWHERLILCFQLTAPFAVGILTPDGDYYVELIAMLGPDIAEFSMCAGGAAGAVAAATGADQVYRFRAVPLAAAVTLAATTTRAALTLAPGPPINVNTLGRVIAAPAPAAGAPGAGGVPPAAAPAAAAPGGGGLAALAAALGGGAPGPGPAGGALVPAAAPGIAPPGGALVPAAAAAAPAPAAPPAAAAPAAGPGVIAAVAAAGPGGDSRVQNVVLDQQGVRFVDFRVGVVRLHEMPWPDWPLQGPRTLL